MDSQDSFMKHIGNTSTPTQKSRSAGTTVVDLDDSSFVLQSILGVGSQTSTSTRKTIVKKIPKRMGLKTGGSVEGIGPMDIKWCMTTQDPSARRVLSLDQVIAKVKQQPFKLTEPPSKVTDRPAKSHNLPVTPARPVTRSRSLNVGTDLSGRREADLGAKSLLGFKAVLNLPIKQAKGIRREGTPESDAGYGTSVQSGSPDTNLAGLVRAMQLQPSSESVITTDLAARRSKLSSISEQDPAVAQAVKRTVPHQSLEMGPNLLSTLLGHSPPTDPLKVVNSLFTSQLNVSGSLEDAAKLYRNAASIYKANCTWSGQLPTTDRTFSAASPMYSAKVFLGGVPWDVTEQCLAQSFRQFGPIRVEWPGKGRDGSCSPKGYLYVMFEVEGAVASLLEQCTHDYSGGGAWYYRISSRRTRAKDVQIIPWLLEDSNFVRCSSPCLDPNKTVFVGALHGMLTAEGLSHVFNDLFGGVIYAGIDTDRYKYPIGSGRVTFNSAKSYMKAVSAAFIEIKTLKFVKKVQVDPYLEDKVCNACGLKQGPYFCRDPTCFTYYCRYCWELLHCSSLLQHHKPLMRNTKGGGGAVNRPIEPPGLYFPGFSG